MFRASSETDAVRIVKINGLALAVHPSMAPVAEQVTPGGDKIINKQVLMGA
jgi:hypothetical protein